MKPSFDHFTGNQFSADFAISAYSVAVLTPNEKRM